MYFESNKQRKDFILRKAAILRSAAAVIKDLKPVILSFDGKVYNKRLDEAIRAIKSDMWITAGLERDNSFFYIRATPAHCYNDGQYLIYTKAARAGEDRETFTDSKRIKADVMINMLNEKYADLNKKAYELETYAAKLEETLKEIDYIKELYNKFYHAIPYELHDVYGLRNYI